MTAISHEPGPAEDLFLGWLLALPLQADVADAALVCLRHVRAEAPPSPLRDRFCELLRLAASPAAALTHDERRRGREARRTH